ncbi:hypothetical protein HPP92_028853 [Vanilla planifolia]|uniref:Uncharacterized protein n=1 Tax=Vanilla planifolia TaxID=51239 RepID=A0A835U3H3_VANPL|nr:hypothetical protein HPP92_028853 [Vanilla planifolia]KAG0446425.1 hypothetical protein HPP92_028842 [Vanilla planifolia]
MQQGILEPMHEMTYNISNCGRPSPLGRRRHFRGDPTGAGRASRVGVRRRPHSSRWLAQPGSSTAPLPSDDSTERITPSLPIK